jgi:hypothetical protein
MRWARARRGAARWRAGLAAGAAVCLLGTADFAAAAPAPDTTAAEPAAPAVAGAVQRDIFDVLHDWVFGARLEPQLERATTGVVWTMLPTLSYNPVYGLAIGASVSGAGRFGKHPGAKPSAISIAGNYSTTGQLQAQFKGDIYPPIDGYLAKLDVRYIDTERSTWGLGPIEAGQEEYPMQFKLTRYYATVFRRVAEPVYVGLGFHYDDYMDIVDERAVNGESTPFSEYSGGTPTRTRASGISFNLLADTRDNLVNPTSGYYLVGTFRDYLESLGSDRNWQDYWIELRLYPHLPRRSPNVLAFWVYSWLSFGPGPYLALPSNGWDTYGRGSRGYLQGRIRGANQIYIESEYRFPLRRDGLLGAVAFFNATITTVPVEQIFGRGDKAAGVGLRVKFNKHSNTNLAVDHAWGEAGSKGWFLGLTEVF